MKVDTTTRGGVATNSWHGQQACAPSFDSNIRDIIGCELAAEVIRSSGILRLRAAGASMLPAVWPGDVLLVSGRNATDARPGEIVLFKRARRLVAHRVVKNIESTTGRQWVTRGDSVEGNDAPVTRNELLGRITLIERGSRQIIPNQSTLSRVASWILSRSDFATKVVLKVAIWVRRTQDSKLKFRESRIEMQDLA